MSTTESQVNNAQAPATAETANEFVGFQNVEVTATEKGPALPDPAVHGLVVNAAKLAEILKSVNAGDKVSAEMATALTGRPAGFLVLSLFPVPRGNEIDNRKARKVYGAGKGLDLPFADPDNNRLQITSLVYAPIKKEEGDAPAATTDTEKDLEE